MGAFSVGSPAPTPGATLETVIETASPVFDCIVKVFKVSEASTRGTFVSISVSNSCNKAAKVSIPPATSTATLITTPLTVIL